MATNDDDSGSSRAGGEVTETSETSWLSRKAGDAAAWHA
jgi:hypothetical protein